MILSKQRTYTLLGQAASRIFCGEGINVGGGGEWASESIMEFIGHIGSYRPPHDSRMTNSGLTTTWRAVLDRSVIESSNKLAAACPISNVDQVTVVKGTRNMSP